MATTTPQHPTMLPRYAVIVAGGRGERMQSDIPKQFLPIGGRPVLMHTLERFYGLVERIVLVLPRDQISQWARLCGAHDFTLPHTLALGGATRFESVRSGLASLPASGLVAIHDGVRPFASRSLIEACFSTAEVSGAALPVIPISNSLRRRSSETESVAIDRSSYVAVQTPQTFRLDRIRAAYEIPYSPSFTDDASVYESAEKGSVSLVRGEVTNIKLTTSLDLKLAELLLQSPPSP